MARPPNDRLLEWLAQPSVLVNLFRIKRPETYSDRYLYIPGDSFRLPGEHALENTDIDPGSYPYQSLNTESETYVFNGPAFVAWPAGKQSLALPWGTFDLTQWENVRDNSEPPLGRRIRQIPVSPGLGVTPQLPNFSAPQDNPGIPEAGQVYEHMAATEGRKKYIYDFTPGAHHGWGTGTPLFWAVPPNAMAQTLVQAAQAVNRRPAGVDELTSAASLRDLASRAAPVLQAGGKVSDQDIANMVSFFSGKGLPVKAFTTGLGGDASFFFSGMMERGILWNLNKDPIHQYAMIGGGIGPQAGASVNLTLGFWWGESEEKVIEQIQGWSFYMLFGASYGPGLTIVISFTADQHPYGLTMAVTGGVDIALSLGATYTWFYKPLPTSGGMYFPSRLA